VNRANIPVEDLLPHRGRMKLVEEIIEVDEEKATTLSNVSSNWPLFDGKAVNALILIEIVAQTAGICNCWHGIRTQGEEFVRKGWLVGIKQSHFFVDVIPLNTRIITMSKNIFKFDNFREIAGTVHIHSKIVGEITLQLVQVGSDSL